MTPYLIQALNGLSHAATLFLVACGLSIIFGVTRIVNFAHGSFYMLGAYMAYSFSQILMAKFGAPLGFWAGIVLAALAAGIVGVVMEMVLLRRIYRAPELFQLLATFAGRAPGLKGTVEILGERFPQYHLFLICLSPIVLGSLWLLFHRTRWGVLVRAATQDREMAGALGVNERWLFSSVLFLGSLLAGLGGALQIPKEAVNLQMDIHVIVEAFVVVVIGGMGSVTGAFLASLLVGLLSAFGTLIFPQATLVLTFLVMAAVLVIRPYGLLGKPETHPRVSTQSADAPIRPADRSLILAIAALLAVLTLLPLFGGEYAQSVVTEILILALFAASLHFIMSVGGLVSFGHAAYFGIGAYACALLVTHMSVPMEGGMLAAPAAAASVAILFGWFCIRLSGVYLAMLTLAFAQILWSIAFQSAWTGGDNGILGVWPSAWLGSKTGYYYCTLVLVVLCLFLLRRVIFSPFGYALRAGRDSPLRSDAIGIDVRRQQWAAFTLAGAAAGLAGALYVFHKGSVFPTVLSISQSIDALVMVLLGGLQTLSGPLVGAGVYSELKTELMRATDFWRIAVGASIILLVVAFPQGIVGFIRQRFDLRKD